MRAVSGRRLVVAMAFGILGAIVAIALDAAIAYLREDWTNPLGIVLVGAVAALSGVLPLLTSRSSPDSATQPSPSGAPPQPVGTPPQPAGTPPQPYGPPVAGAPRKRGVPVLVGVLVMLLLCGGGVGAVTFGARYLGGWVTGDEAGVDVLAQERSATAGDLTLTVHSVELTSHFTRVELSAANAGQNPLQLPIFNNCQLIPSGNHPTLAGDDFRSDWTDSVPAGQTVRGVVTFPRLPDGVDTISISFNVIFVLGPTGGSSITIADIPLIRP